VAIMSADGAGITNADVSPATAEQLVFISSNSKRWGATGI